MRRAGSRTADGWWLLLITVLGWLLVSFGGQHVFGQQGGMFVGSRHDIDRRQLQTTDVTSVLSPISVISTFSPATTTNTTKASPSPTNVATTLSPTTDLAAIIAGELSPSPVSSPSPSPTSTPTPSPTSAPTPAATTAGTPAPTVSTVIVATVSPTASPSPTSSPTTAPTLTPTPTPSPTVDVLPTPTPTAVATPAPTASPTTAPTVAAATVTPAATPAATVAATASPTPIPTASPTLAATTATVASSPTLSPTPSPTSGSPSPSPASPAATPTVTSAPTPAAIPTPTETPSPTPIATPAATVSPTATPIPVPVVTSTPTPSPAVAASVASPTPSPVATGSPSPSASPVTASASTINATTLSSPAATISASPSPLATPTSSPLATSTLSPSATATPTPVATPTLTPAVASPLVAVAATATPTPTPTPTNTPIPSLTPSSTAAPTASPLTASSPATSPAPTVTSTPTPTPSFTPTPTPTSSPVQLLSSSANTTSTALSLSPTTASQGVSVPAIAPAPASLSNINATSPSSVDVAPVPGTTASDNSTAPAPAPTTTHYGSPAVAPTAATPTTAVTAPVPAPATAVPVPAPSQNVTVPVPAPGTVTAPVPAPASAAPVPAPAEGVPAPAPSVSVPAAAPSVVTANGTVVAPAPAEATPAEAPAVSTPSAGAPTPSTLTTSNASAPSPDSSTAGIESSNTTAGVPDLAPTPSTAVASAVPTPAEAAPAEAPSSSSTTTTTTSIDGVAVPALAPVSSDVSQYKPVTSAPATWNTTAYSTATLQLTLTNTSVAAFDSDTQTALLNSINNYVVAKGYESFYMGLNSISGEVAVIQASPGAASSAPAEGLAPGVSVTVVVTPSDSTAAAPLIASSSPSPAARRLLADTVTSSGTGVNVNVTITAPASDMNNITALVQQAVSSGAVEQQLQQAGVSISLTEVNVVVIVAGLPGTISVPAVSSPSPVAVLPPSPPTSKSAGTSIGAVAGGIAGGAVCIVGGCLLVFFICKRRSRRNKWTKDLETAKAGYVEEPTNSSDSGSSGDSGRPGGRGRKVAAYMPFGTNSNESVDATPHAKHATLNDAFAGISRFKPDGTLKVNAPRPNLISSATGHQMGTIPERKSYSGAPVDVDVMHLHDTANLLDSHSNNVQTAADHALMSPVSLFSFGTPVSHPSNLVDPFGPIGMVSRPSQGKLSSEGSTNLLLRGGSGDQLLGAHASGDYSDRFQELAAARDSAEPVARRGSSGTGRQYSGNVDANLWSVAWKDLEIQKQIGEGSFGKVFLAKWRETTVAVKLLTYTGVSGSLEGDDEYFNQGMNVLLKGLEQEAGMMASMRHPNVVMYLGVCLQPPCVVTEYCARGSLNDVFKRARATPALAAQLDWGRRLNMVLDAAKGMMYLHSSEPPVIHRDLKSPNLLVDKHWRIKVCDFNLSRVMEESAILSSMAASNPRWLAPEILSGRGYTFSSDVYSFGVIMWEFLTWQIPWHECGPWQVVALVTEGAQRPELPAFENLPGSGPFAGYSEYLMLMEQCWHQDPAARPTFAQVITVLRKLLAAEMRAKVSNTSAAQPQ